MLLFIRRATQMEQAYEKKPTLNAEAIAQMRSGGLLTALPPGGYHPRFSRILSFE